MLLAAVLSTVVTDQPAPQQDYAAAYRTAQQEGKPLMVVVGADWCPACVNLKSQTIASMKQSGELQDVSIAVVDQDDQPELAAQLKRGRTIPQIIVFSQTPAGGWKRIQLTGFQSETTMQSVLSKAKQLSQGS
ncbi:thioredoxin family protein [Roseimaritima sediminicola]|uniref:thioredoxin family protein n=1 Tax=Roseimaritima sediminicola TaxID=2662066 RepID=UPI001F2E692E|nr:thioredoxin family protein [Roseimaritima sediminicola]